MRIRTRIFVAILIAGAIILFGGIGPLYYFSSKNLRSEIHKHLITAGENKLIWVNFYFSERKKDLDVLVDSPSVQRALSQELVEEANEAKKDIRSRAEEVAEEVGAYLKKYPGKTIKDLQNDPVFQKIAVQPVGQSGYTALTDYDTLICRFHQKEPTVDLDLHTLADKLSGFWSVMLKTEGGQAFGGFYDWQEPDGSFKKKYMYLAIVDARTADGVGLSVAATAYLDEYGQGMTLLKEAEKHLREFKETYDYENLMVVGPEGDVWWVAKEDSDGGLGVFEKKESQLALAFEKSTETKETNFSDYEINAKTGRPAAYIASPVFFGGVDELAGAVILQLNIDQINQIIENRAGLGETGETYLVGADYLMRSDSRFSQESTILKQKVETENTRNCFSMKEYLDRHQGREPLTVFNDYRGNRVLGTHFYIPEQDWCLMAEIDEGEVLAPLNQLLMASILALFFMIGMIGMVAFWLNRSIIRPILALRKGIKVVEEGNLDHQVGLKKKDEIGQLSQAFDRMTAAVKKSRAEVDQKVESQTKQLKQQNLDLEESKQAMLSLLEDSKELEESLKEERDRIRQIVASMGEGLLLVDKDFKIALMNPTAEKLLETTKKEAIGQPWSEFVTAYKGKKIIPFEKRTSIMVLKSGKSLITKIGDDHYYKTKSDKMFPVASVTAPLKRDGEVVGAVKVFRDATEEKESKDLIEKKVKERTNELKVAKDKIADGWLQLQHEKARLVASLDSLSLGLIIIDSNCELVMMNPAVEKIIGSLKEPKTFKAINERLGGAIDLMVQCQKCLDKSKPVEIREIEFEDKFLRMFSAPVTMLEKTEKVIGAVILIEDATESKVLDRSRNEFFALASHELRTPLTAIRGNSSLMRQFFGDQIKENKDLDEMVTDIYDSSVRLIKIVSDFLDASRLELEKLEFKKEEFDLVSLAKKATQDLEQLALGKDLKLEFIGPKGGLRVFADSERAQQVIINLVGNAIKFTKKGEVEISVGKKGKTAQVKVKDTGTGIAKKNQRLLFHKFQQAGEKILARDVTKGTGMGLYISKLLAEGMGGKVYLEKSEKDKGSTFVFELPMKIKNEK
ncbi:ATP-binding protein [Patescibacteria group bacterium]